MVTAGGLQVWTTRTHDCKNGCICTEVVEGRYARKRVVINLECPVRGHTNHVRSVCFSLDGTRIASGADDKLLKVWDAATGAEVPTRECWSVRALVLCITLTSKATPT